MALYAHTETGFALDVWENASEAEYLARFPHAEGWTVVTVPDGTKHGAVDNGDGTFTNPSLPETSPLPKTLSKTAFQDYAVSQFGGAPDGMSRFTEIMDSTKNSEDGAVRFAYARYEAALTFEKTATASLTALMAADSTTGHMTSAERTTILDNWPTV